MPQNPQPNANAERGNQGKPGFENEGEGNKTAARRFNQAQEEYAHSGRAEHAAEEAKKALDSDEGPELREAEEATRATEPEPESRDED